MFHRRFSQDIKLKQYITSQHSMRLHMPASHDCHGKHELPERERGILRILHCRKATAQEAQSTEGASFVPVGRTEIQVRFK